MSKHRQHVVNPHLLPHLSSSPESSNQTMVELQNWPDTWGVLGKCWMGEEPPRTRPSTKLLGTQQWTERQDPSSQGIYFLVDHKPANKEIKTRTPVTGKCGDRNKTQRCNSIRMGWRGKDSIRKDGQGSLSEEVTCGPRPEY